MIKVEKNKTSNAEVIFDALASAKAKLFANP